MKKFSSPEDQATHDFEQGLTLGQNPYVSVSDCYKWARRMNYLFNKQANREVRNISNELFKQKDC